MSATSDRAPSAPRTQPTYADILCAVDGSRGSAEGVRHAIELARPGGRVTFVCVSDARGTGANRVASVGEHRASGALGLARLLAREQGIRIETELVHATDPVEELLGRQREHDLLVIGSHPVSRAGGIMVGDTATTLAHRTAGPLLVARASASTVPFPGSVVVAMAAGPEGDPVIDTAVRLTMPRGAQVDIVHATPRRGHARRARSLAPIAASVWIATGREPILTEEPGDPVELGLRAVTRDRADLLVAGHGGLTGLGALGSVSERLVHRVRCSVLIVPTAPAA